jgi:hypothetical protein
MAVCMRMDISGPHSSTLPDLQVDPAHGAVRALRRHRAVAGSVRLTERCMDLLKLLWAARWLTTGQIHRRFFPGATMDAARKRLRKLTRAKVLLMVQPHQMMPALFTLAVEGRRVLEIASDGEIVLERKPPAHVEHFVAINDLRIAAEMSGSLQYFFSHSELAGIGWRSSILPDAVFSLGGKTYAAEVDRGMEGVGYFVRTKMLPYRRGLEGFPLTALLIITESSPRMASLARAIGNSDLVLFSTFDLVRGNDFARPIFCREPGGSAVALV